MPRNDPLHGTKGLTRQACSPRCGHIVLQVQGGWAAAQRGAQGSIARGTAVGTGEHRLPGFELQRLEETGLDHAQMPQVYGLIRHGVPLHDHDLVTLTFRCARYVSCSAHECSMTMRARMRACV